MMLTDVTTSRVELAASQTAILDEPTKHVDRQIIYIFF